MITPLSVGEDFSFTEKDFQGFLKYLKTTNFNFETQTELKFKQALRRAEDDGLKKTNTVKF